MIESKEEFLRTFLPDSVEDIMITTIDLDATDLSIADILRNVNTIFPENSRARNAIASGRLVIGIKCRSKYLKPLSGLFLLIRGEKIDTPFVSKNHIVLSISEDNLYSDDDIVSVTNGIAKYLISEFAHCLGTFTELYTRYIYNEDEQNAEYIL